MPGGVNLHISGGGNAYSGCKFDVNHNEVGLVSIGPVEAEITLVCHEKAIPAFERPKKTPYVTTFSSGNVDSN